MPLQVLRLRSCRVPAVFRSLVSVGFLSHMRRRFALEMSQPLFVQ